MFTRKKILCIFALIFILLVGLACIAYPAFSSWYNEQHKAEVQTQYENILENTHKDAINAAKDAAIQYNEKLFRNELDIQTPVQNGYFDLLNISGNGIMGYINIPAIDVHLAIYHDVEEPAISIGAGHLPETSLPVGGENTHAALSAHSGMASNALFSELERLGPGDLIYIDILGETLTYQILSEDDIVAVLPNEVDRLAIIPGQDLITLITCVPYGVNTHRLLVRASRVETPADTSAAAAADTPSGEQEPQTMSIRTQNYIKGILTGIFAGMLLILASALIVLILKKHNEKKPDANEIAVRTETTLMAELHY